MGRGGDKGPSRSSRALLRSTPEVNAEKRVGNSTSESGPRDMKDPGKSCVAVSGQRAKLGPWQVRGCRDDEWMRPPSLSPASC